MESEHHLRKPIEKTSLIAKSPGQAERKASVGKPGQKAIQKRKDLVLRVTLTSALGRTGWGGKQQEGPNVSRQGGRSQGSGQGHGSMGPVGDCQRRRNALDWSGLQVIKQFHDTTHAGIRRGQRAVSLQDMRDVVNHHDAKRQQYRGEHGGFVYKFIKNTGLSQQVVVAEVKAEECWLMSAWNT
jgi:hypothetical protein